MNKILIEKVICLINEGKSQDEVLEMLSENCSIMNAIIIVREVYKIPLGDAKKMVSSSHFWLEKHNSNEILHEALELAFSDELEKSVNIIFPYKYSGMWVFDDDEVGLKQEPFVEGADTMIDTMVKAIPNADKGFSLFFSDEKFSGIDMTLEWKRADGGGNWYYSQKLDMEGWLCPALFKYFNEIPKNIYIKIMAQPK